MERNARYTIIKKANSKADCMTSSFMLKASPTTTAHTLVHVLQNSRQIITKF